MKVRAIVLALFLGLAPLSSAVLAQQIPPVLDSPDVDLNPMFLHNPNNSARMMDMQYTQSGYLVVAFVERDLAGSDQLVVVSRSPGGQWVPLHNQSYGHKEILEMSLTVPEEGGGGNPDRDRVYIVAHFVDGASEKLALISGPWTEPWSAPRIAWEMTVPNHPDRSKARWSPGVACVPRTPRDFAEYTVEVVFSYPLVGTPWETGIYRVRSEDYGNSLEPSIYLAGPGATGSTASELDNLSFAEPSICADADRARVIIAIRDDANSVIHLLSGTSNNPKLDLLHTTPGADLNGMPRLEREPVIECFDRNLVLTFLTTDISGYGFSALNMKYGNSTTGNFSNPRELHPYAVTKGDIALREGQVYVAARLYKDDSWPQQSKLKAWSGTLDGQGYWSVQLDDRHSECRRPHIAVTRAPVNVKQSVGYSVDDGRVGVYGNWQSRADTISIDF